MQKLAKVLLVDDNQTVNFLHTQLLKRFLIVEQLLVAHNGLEALQTGREGLEVVMVERPRRGLVQGLQFCWLKSAQAWLQQVDSQRRRPAGHPRWR